MATKAKKFVPSLPKLGWQDHLLYSISCVLTFGASIAVTFISFDLQERYAFSYEEVAAANGGPGNMNSIFLFMWLSLVCVIVVSQYSQRFPIFGNKNVRYGPPGYPRVYPVFMKNKPKHWVSQQEIAKKKRQRNWIIVALVSTFLFSLFTFCLSIRGREVLLYNGTVQVYNGWDRQKEDYRYSEIEKVIITTHLSQSRGSSQWFAKMEIHFQDGESCGYYHTAFRGDTKQQLQEMIRLKELYADRFVIEGTENLRDVIMEYDFDEAEQLLLYELFEYVQ